MGTRRLTIYQIFPDRFAPPEPHEEVPQPLMPWGVWVGNPEKAKYKVGGTLKGILDHVNHLKELAIGAVYLNPCSRPTGTIAMTLSTMPR